MTVVDKQREFVESDGSAKKYRAMDLDGHFREPETMWSEYLPSKYRDFAPRAAVDSLGRKRRIIGNELLPYIERRDVFHPHDHPNVEEPPPEACGWDPQTRLAVMDAEGVEIHVMYPDTGLHIAAVRDLEAAVALCQAYNNWASDFCSAAPDRLIAQAVVPQRSVAEARKELDRAVNKRNMGGVYLRPNPVGPAIEDPLWEPFWSQIEEYDVPLGFHCASAYGIPQFGDDRTENFLFQHAMYHPFEHMAAMLSLICGGVLERHPNLRVVFAEAGCGWVPYWLERMEYHVSRIGLRNVKLSLGPTEYFKRQCIVTMDSDERSVVPSFVLSLGADNLGWSTDFPHVDHLWHGMVGELLDRSDLTEADKVKIIGANSIRFYKR